MIMGLLVSGGFFGVTAAKGKNTTVSDMLQVIGAVIITIVSLAMFSGSVIGYIDALITAATGFAKTAYGILPIILYVGIIAGASTFIAVKAFRKSRGSRSSLTITVLR